MRVKDVTVKSTAGTSVRPPAKSRICTADPVEMLIDCHRAPSCPDRPAAHAVKQRLRCGGGKLQLAAGQLLCQQRVALIEAEKPCGARLSLAVAVNRDDAVLGHAEQDEVASGAHERERST